MWFSSRKQASTSLSLTVNLSGNPIFIGHNERMTESSIKDVIFDE
jgi:hypothetical protein